MLDEIVARYDALLNALDAMVFVTDFEGKMLYANPQLERETGYTAEDFQFQQEDNPFLHPNDAARVGAFIAEFAASDAPHSTPVENRFYDRWGKVHWYSSVIAKVEYGGQPALQFITRPIADSAQGPAVEQQASEQRYRTLVEKAHDAIVLYDADGRILFANRQMHRMLDYDAVTLSKRLLGDLAHLEDQDKLRRHLTASAADLTDELVQVRLLTRSEDIRWVEARLCILREDNSAQERLAIVRDVTKQKLVELERQALERQNLKSRDATIREMQRHEEYVCEVAHQLRNPAQVLRGTLDLFHSSNLTDEQKKLLVLVRRNCKRLIEGIEQLT